MNIKIDNKFKSLIPPLEEEEYKTLKKSIINEGCREPLTLWNGIIIDGHNRYKICHNNKIKFKTINKKFKDENEVILWMIDNQLGRRNINKWNRIILALKKENILKSIAEINLKISTGGKNSSTLPNSAKSIDVRDEIAKIAKVGHDTIWKAKYIVKKAPKEMKKKLKKGDETISKAFIILKRAEKENEREKERKKDKKKAENIKSPEELFKEVKFTTVVIDPPWDWSDEGDVNQMGRAKPDYSTISFEDLKKLPIDDLTKKDAHIYLWITNRSLPKGFELLKAWGFRYIVCLTWCKPSFGLGNYFRGSTEQILFGVKGSLPLKRKDVGTWFAAPRGKGGHSSKPDEFYKLVESCSPGLYLDYFSRDKRDGWYTYGIGDENKKTKM